MLCIYRHLRSVTESKIQRQIQYEITAVRTIATTAILVTKLGVKIGLSSKVISLLILFL